MPNMNNAPGAQGDSGQSGTATGQENTPADAGAGAASTGDSNASGIAGKAGDGKTGSNDLDLNALPENAQKYIRDLRQESAGYRTKSKEFENRFTTIETQLNGVKKAFGLEKEELTEERFDAMANKSSELELKNAVLESAYTLGVPPKGLDYFQYLVGSKVSELGEGQELGDEALAGLAQEAKSKFSDAFASKTSVDSGNSKTQTGQNPGASGEVNLDAFVAMTTSEKSELYAKTPELYNKLKDAAFKANRFV